MTVSNSRWFSIEVGSISCATGSPAWQLHVGNRMGQVWGRWGPESSWGSSQVEVARVYPLGRIWEKVARPTHLPAVFHWGCTTCSSPFDMRNVFNQVGNWIHVFQSNGKVSITWYPVQYHTCHLGYQVWDLKWSKAKQVVLFRSRAFGVFQFEVLPSLPSVSKSNACPSRFPCNIWKSLFIKRALLQFRETRAAASSSPQNIVKILRISLQSKLSFFHDSNVS